MFFRILFKVSKYARRFPCGRWSFLRPVSDKKLYKTCSDKPDGNWDRTAEMMILQLNTEAGHQHFRASSALERRDLESREHGKTFTHFNDNEGNIELLLRTVISVNQLSIYGFLADWCKKTGTKTHPKSQPPPLTDQKAQEHFIQKKYWR